MRTGKEAGIVKYDSWFRAHPKLILEPKDYVGLFKMIAMYFQDNLQIIKMYGLI